MSDVSDDCSPADTALGRDILPLPGPGRAGFAHAAACRRARRPAVRRIGRDQARHSPSGAGSALLIGAGIVTITLTRLLVGLGWQVAVLEDDADTARRQQTRLGQLGLAVPVLCPPLLQEFAPCLANVGLVVAFAAPSPAQLGVLMEIPGRTNPVRQLVTLCETGEEAEALAEAWCACPGLSRPPCALRLVNPGSGLVEVFRTASGGRDIPAPPPLVQDLIAALGCCPVPVPAGSEGPGTRLLTRFFAVAEALCLAGAAPWELDEAAEDLGFADGPCALMDRLGLDSVLPRRARLSARDKARPDPGVVARMVAEGRLGRQASVGWYRYPGGGGRVVDPLVEDLVREEAWFSRFPQRSFSARQMQALLLVGLIGEARALLEDGSVEVAGDVDLAAILCLGFPARLGGPVWLGWQLPAAWLKAELARLDEILACADG